ncbi:MAG: hypothetical protein AAFO82_07185, partial [Bacteroidota bacterium]
MSLFLDKCSRRRIAYLVGDTNSIKLCEHPIFGNRPTQCRWFLLRFSSKLPLFRTYWIDGIEEALDRKT